MRHTAAYPNCIDLESFALAFLALTSSCVPEVSHGHCCGNMGVRSVDKRSYGNFDFRSAGLQYPTLVEYRV